MYALDASEEPTEIHQWQMTLCWALVMTRWFKRPSHSATWEMLLIEKVESKGQYMQEWLQLGPSGLRLPSYSATDEFLWRTEATYMRHCVRSVLLYGSENLTITQRLERCIVGCDRHMLRYMAGVSLRDWTTSEEVAEAWKMLPGPN